MYTMLTGTNEPIAEDGPNATVVWATDANGKTDARNYYCSLNQRDKSKVKGMFAEFALLGSIKNNQRFKKLRDVRRWSLFEFKSFQIRFIGAYMPQSPKRKFIVAHGLHKKKDRVGDSDLERAARILDEHVARIQYHPNTRRKESA